MYRIVPFQLRFGGESVWCKSEAQVWWDKTATRWSNRGDERSDFTLKRCTCARTLRRHKWACVADTSRSNSNTLWRPLSGRSGHSWVVPCCLLAYRWSLDLSWWCNWYQSTGSIADIQASISKPNNFPLGVNQFERAQLWTMPHRMNMLPDR